MVQGNASMGTVHNGQSPCNSWDLVAAAQRGDRDAFGHLYERYVGQVFRFVLRWVGDRPLAEDLTFETFLRALRHIDSAIYRERDVGTWLMVIARNLVPDHRKSHRTRREQPTAELCADAAVNPGPEQVAAERDTAAQLARRIAQLPAEQQWCLQLRFWQGLSTAETAVALGRTESCVKALQHRAVRKLARLLPEGVA